MNWIRKTVIFVSLFILAFFFCQANESAVQQTESQKTDTNFSIDSSDALAFIQPQTSYQFAANIKTNLPFVTKWFDSILPIVPQSQAVHSTSNFARQFSTQSRKMVLILYAFHFFW